jgi:TnpA family transposase
VPSRELSDAEFQAMSSWPIDIAHSDLVTFVDLSVGDVRWLNEQRGDANRLGMAVLLCAVRHLGYVPDDIGAAPLVIVEALADGLGVSASLLGVYAADVEDRRGGPRRHLTSVLGHLGWTVCGRGEWKRLGEWLLARALEHDDATVLFRDALDQLRIDQVLRPSLDELLRAVATARVRANTELHQRLAGWLTPDRRQNLGWLIEPDTKRGVAPFVWLGTQATTESPKAINNELDKLDLLVDLGATAPTIGVIPAERRRQLAAIARRSSPKAMRQMPVERRHLLLVSSVAELHAVITDEVVALFDRALNKIDNTARHGVDDHNKAVAAADVERLRLLDEIIAVIRNDHLDNDTVGRQLRGLGRDRLAAAQRTPAEHLPRDGGHLELIATRYNTIRRFAPRLLAALGFESSIHPSPVLEAIGILRVANESNARTVSFDVPDGFVPTRWQPYLDAACRDGDRVLFKHYWELCVLYALRAGLRSGEIWVQHSRRYANPATFLIPPDDWQRERADMLERIRQPETWQERLQQIDTGFADHLTILYPMLKADTGPIRLDRAGHLRLTPLAAEVLPDHVDPERTRLAGRLPLLHLPELLTQVDNQAHFTNELTHASGATPRTGPTRHRQNLFAAVTAQACNLGITRMAALSGISVDTLEHYTRWYLREDTLKAANNAIVNAHHRLPLTNVWGGGTLSSSDGLRLPMEGKSITARALKGYFVDEGITSYLHVSDQHTTYGTQIIVSTDRDATYTLDEILGNTTELAIDEHTVDTHGQTLATFALFDLCGYRLSPRIAKLTERQLWRPHRTDHYQLWPTAGPLLQHHAQVDVIERHWDDLLRIAGSLREGTVSASLLIARLQASARQHPLSKALIEYGKLIRTMHSLRWFTDETFRRRIGRQLNKGEAMNELRQQIAFAHGQLIWHRHHEDQTMQAHCLTLVTNACILSTTNYLQDAIDAERAAGRIIHNDTLPHISPARWQHINFYGTYNFDTTAVPDRHPLRHT